MTLDMIFEISWLVKRLKNTPEKTPKIKFRTRFPFLTPKSATLAGCKVFCRENFALSSEKSTVKNPGFFLRRDTIIIIMNFQYNRSLAAPLFIRLHLPRKTQGLLRFFFFQSRSKLNITCRQKGEIHFSQTLVMADCTYKKLRV